ncbi:putative GPI-anchored cupredoxin [Paramyrothecium foliicola]|nr:putative GPI-anchored cupredoxin [Paramyrothecium foliicola]
MKASLLWLFPAIGAALPQPAVHAEVVTSAKRPFRIRRNEPLVGRQNRLIPVVVGGAQDTFVPNSVKAAVGDVVQFQFSSGNHTVTQSSETEACKPLQLVNPQAVHSGHIPFQAGQTTVGTFTMIVTSAEPMFLYCATGPHCQEGQVMVINPTNDLQILNYSKLSAAAAENIDGGAVSGGTAGQIFLQSAAFNPPPPEQGPPAAPPAAPPAEAPAEAPPAPPATTSAAPPAEAPAAPPAETPAPPAEMSAPPVEVPAAAPAK